MIPPKILVIGSTNVDFVIKSERLPAFGETVTDGVFSQTFGGKGANQAVGAARAGGRVSFVTCLGEDLYAETLTRNFIKDGIDTSCVFRETGVSTGSALIMLDKEGNNYLSVAPGANYRLGKEHIDRALPLLKEAEIIVLQMEIPFETTAYIFHLAQQHRKKIIFNLAPARSIDPAVLKSTYAFVVNEVEAAMVSGLPQADTEHQIKEAGQVLLEKGPEVLIITMGSRGAYITTKSSSEFVPAFRVKPVDTTAAGDVFCGSLATALVERKSLRDAVTFATAASAISVTRLGAQPSAPTRTEIDRFLNENH